MNQSRALISALLLCASLLALSGCGTLTWESGAASGEAAGSAGRQTAAASTAKTAAVEQPSPAAAPRGGKAAEDPRWNLAVLDTARSVSYMTTVEKDVILEVNKARTNPALYAELYIKPILAYFSGRDYSVPGKITIRTTEGAAAVKECLAAMAAQAPRPPLTPKEALARAGRDHVKDTGPKGTVGHQGSDGSDPMARVGRYAANLYVGENISYGPDQAREIVIQFLVDDGVPSRGHRENIMRDGYALIGVSIGSHKTYGSMCVIDFALAPR